MKGTEYETGDISRRRQFLPDEAEAYSDESPTILPLLHSLKRTPVEKEI